MSKNIVRFSKSKAQFEENISEAQPESTTQASDSIESKNKEDLTNTQNNYECKTDGKLNPVASRKQTLINGRIFELHMDAQGNIVRKIRIRSSGLPYLTDEETDPSSREQSDNGSDIEILS